VDSTSGAPEEEWGKGGMTYQLQAQLRTVNGKQTKRLREQGLLPGVVYGKNIENKNIQLAQSEFIKIFRDAGYSTLIELSIQGTEPLTVLVSDVAYDRVSNLPMHVDFHRIDMREKLHTRIPLHFAGEARAVKEGGGILVKVMDQVDIECLPKDLVSSLEVPLGKLEKIGGTIRVSDLQLPAGIRILTKGEEVIAAVEAPREEVIPPAAEAAPKEPEVIKKGVQKEAELEQEEKQKA